MGDQQALLVRYQVMAQLRVHFSQLFFGTIFAVLITAFGIGFAGKMLLQAQPAYICFAITANFAFGTIIARRLMLRERGCFAEMQAAWRQVQSPGADQPAPLAPRPGAMNMLLWAMAALAVGMFAAGLYSL